MSRTQFPIPSETEVSTGLGVGPYRLVRRIARGGMGDVWLAQRADGVLRRPVAIKLMHGHLLDPALEQRFRSEREILAALDHPHIARLVDGGVTDSGVPYVAMEYVDGEPLDDYCRQREPSLPERLKLFQQVCEAVHYAHRHLIVHRDVKPENILVTREGSVKLLDFGIAKLLRPEFGAFTHAITRPFDRLMTPEYASPEQLRGEPVSTATDVYSLGLMLAVLVTGRLPYPVHGRDTNEIRQIVCEQDTPRLTDVPADIAAIVAKALRKEPEGRYASVEHLSDDVRRYLDGFPVRAHEGHWRYLTGKFVRRHRLAVAFSTVLLGVLLAAGVLLTGLNQQYKRERDTARAVEGFLLNLFDASDPQSTLRSRGELPARALVDRAAASLRKEFAHQPAVEASLAEKLGDVYRQLGLYQQALPLFERSLMLEAQVSGDDAPSVAAIAVRLADLLRELQQYDRAEQLAQRSLHIRRARLGPHDLQVADSLNVLGILQQIRGRLPESRDTFAEALRIRRASLPAVHHDTAVSLGNLGNVEKALGNLDAAEALFAEALAMRRKEWGDQHPRVGSSIGQLAQVALTRGEVTRALTLSNQALSIARAAYPDGNPALANQLNAASAAHREAGEWAQAEALSREALALEQRFHGPEAPEYSFALAGLAAALMEQGKLAEAGPLVRDSLRIRRARLGDGHTVTARAYEQLAAWHQLSGNLPQAAELYARALAARRAKLGDDHPEVALLRFASGDRAAAIEQLRRRLPGAQNLEAKLWIEWSRREPARRAELLEHARAALQRSPSPDPIWVRLSQ